MIKRKAAFLFITFLFLSPVKAMEDMAFLDEALQPVTIRLWKNPDGSHKNEHVSVATQKYNMSFRSRSPEGAEETADPDLSIPSAWACPDHEEDQWIQNRALQRDNSETWSCETIVLHLKTKAMDEFWDQLLENAECVIDGLLMHYRFKNVHYVNEKMRERFVKERNLESSKPDKTLYFTNTTMALAVLGTGGFYNEGVYCDDHAKYFQIPLAVTFLMDSQAVYMLPIECNRDIRADDLSVSDIADKLLKFVRRQMLIKINQLVKQNHYGFTALSPEDEKALREIVEVQESQEERQKKVHTYLEELKNKQKWFFQRWW